MKDELQHYINTQKEIFLSNFDNAISKQELDAVHDLRVAVKRINAVIRLINHNQDIKSISNKHIFNIKLLYKKLGPFRDIHVIKALLKKQNNSKEIKVSQIIKNLNIAEHILTDLFEYDKTLFKKRKAKKSFTKIKKQAISFNESILLDKYYRLIKDREVSFLKYINKNNPEYDLHKARKMIKELSYLFEIQNSKEIQKKLKTYKELGSLLGKWHDADVLYLKLKSPLLTKGTNKETQKIIIEKLLQDKKELKLKIEELIKAKKKME